MRHAAVATSGLAHRGAHVVDARTGECPTFLAAVTVIGTELVWADIDATAGLALDVEALVWLQSRGSRRGLVVRDDGTVELFGQ